MAVSRKRPRPSHDRRTVALLSVTLGVLSQSLLAGPAYSLSSLRLVTSSLSPAASPGRVGRYCRATLLPKLERTYGQRLPEHVQNPATELSTE